MAEVSLLQEVLPLNNNSVGTSTPGGLGTKVHSFTVYKDTVGTLNEHKVDNLLA